jgi:hypothetical protein
MLKKSSVLFFILIFSSSVSFSKEIIRSYFVSSKIKNLPLVARHFEIVSKEQNGFLVYVPEENVEKFSMMVPSAKLLNLNIQSTEKNNSSQYRKYADVERDLIAFSQKYSSLATLETYGISKEGRKLYALKLSTNNLNAKNKTNKLQVLVTAATHGDELITVEVLFSLIGELLEGQAKDSRLQKILDGRDIYFIPVVSPDSFEGRERYVQGIDPNRSFPWPEQEVNKTVDCIQALMDFTNAHQFVGSLDLHAYGRLVMYPWAYTKTPPDSKDAVLFGDLVRRMARENQYTAGQISTTIYVAKGSSADYFYWKKGTKAIAVELAGQKVPPFNTIPKVVTEAREMLWTFFENFN